MIVYSLNWLRKLSNTLQLVELHIFILSAHLQIQNFNTLHLVSISMTSSKMSARTLTKTDLLKVRLYFKNHTDFESHLRFNSGGLQLLIRKEIWPRTIWFCVHMGKKTTTAFTTTVQSNMIVWFVSQVWNYGFLCGSYYGRKSCYTIISQWFSAMKIFKNAINCALFQLSHQTLSHSGKAFSHENPLTINKRIYKFLSQMGLKNSNNPYCGVRKSETTSKKTSLHKKAQISGLVKTSEGSQDTLRPQRVSVGW